MKKAVTFAFSVACIALAVLATGVLAHAKLVSSDPADGGTLTTTPYTLKATFDEELTPDGSSLEVVNAQGSQVALGGLSATDDKLMTVELPQLPQGPYEARWTAVTADDLAVERGTFKFNVGSVANPPAATPTAAPGAPTSGTGSTSDLFLVFVLVGIVVVAVLAFLFLRNRR
jgi:methionine-rich copper-binding protein CopC